MSQKWVRNCQTGKNRKIWVLTGAISPDDDVGDAECAQEDGDAAFPIESGELTCENGEKCWPKVDVA